MCKNVNLEREHYGIVSGTIGIFLNFLLFLGKFIAGFAANSVSIMADALNNFSDVASSVVTIVGFKISSKKADDEHPFGHGRMEYISGLIVSFFIIILGFELFKSSVESIINPEKLNFSLFTIIFLSSSILVKFIMFVLNMRFFKKTKSCALKAIAKDSLSDMISTLLVLFSVAFSFAKPNSNIPLDGIAGVIVAFFIIAEGISSCRDTINPLLGVPASKVLIEEIKEVVLSFKPICGIHDILIHDYGPDRMMISLHAEVPGDRNVFELHNIIEDAEIAVAKKFNASVTIHLDPVDFSNHEVIRLKEYLEKSAEQIDENLSVHDVRLVACSNDEPGLEVRFDALRPHKLKMSDEELKEKFKEKVNEFNPSYKCVIQIDNAFS